MHFDYRPMPFTESLPHLNAVCLLVLMIETVEGLENVEAIAAAVRRGALFLTTQTDIGFLAAAAGQWTRGLRAALDSEPLVAR